MCYQLLWLGGFDPELARCTVCLKPIFRGRLNISLINGGLVHASCAYSEVSLSVDREVLYLVNDMKKTDPQAVLSQNLNSATWNDFRKLTQFFFQYYFGLDIGELI
jgi:recombinational DNA repair protein (RecF pathway)